MGKYHLLSLLQHTSLCNKHIVYNDLIMWACYDPPASVKVISRCRTLYIQQMCFVWVAVDDFSVTFNYSLILVVDEKGETEVHPRESQIQPESQQSSQNFS